MANRPTVYGYSSARDFLRAARAVRGFEKAELRPKKGRKPPRAIGTGGDFKACVGKTTDYIGPAQNNGSSRVPGGGQIEILVGEGSSAVDNWSSVGIDADTYVICITIGSANVIVDAFC